MDLESKISRREIWLDIFQSSRDRLVLFGQIEGIINKSCHENWRSHLCASVLCYLLLQYELRSSIEVSSDVLSSGGRIQIPRQLQHNYNSTVQYHFIHSYIQSKPSISFVSA